MGADLRGRNAEAIITGRCYIKLFQNLLGLVRQTFSVLPLTDAPTTATALGFGRIGKVFGVKLLNLDIFWSEISRQSGFHLQRV